MIYETLFTYLSGLGVDLQVFGIIYCGSVGGKKRDPLCSFPFSFWYAQSTSHDLHILVSISTFAWIANVLVPIYNAPPAF